MQSLIIHRISEGTFTTVCVHTYIQCHTSECAKAGIPTLQASLIRRQTSPQDVDVHIWALTGKHWEYRGRQASALAHRAEGAAPAAHRLLWIEYRWHLEPLHQHRCQRGRGQLQNLELKTLEHSWFKALAVSVPRVQSSCPPGRYAGMHGGLASIQGQRVMAEGVRTSSLISSGHGALLRGACCQVRRWWSCPGT